MCKFTTPPTLEDLERRHPAGIFVEDHYIFYMLNDACELGGYHVLSSKGPEMLFERELDYAEFALLSHEETEELKQIANQIKNNLDKIFKDFYSRTWH